MRARTTAATRPSRAAEDSLQARFDAGRAWSLEVPERAEWLRQRAVEMEAQVTPEALEDVYQRAGGLALLRVDLDAVDALARLADAGRESWPRRTGR